MSLWSLIRRPFEARRLPTHLQRGERGEQIARAHLADAGITCVTTNFRCRYGEIDMVCRDRDCLVFVEVKTRSGQRWGRPADAVDRKRQLRLSRAALVYLRRIKNPSVKARFDVVEVILNDDQVQEIRHLPNAFPFTTPGR
jgi:putative endonuclease